MTSPADQALYITNDDIRFCGSVGLRIDAVPVDYRSLFYNMADTCLEKSFVGQQTYGLGALSAPMVTTTPSQTQTASVPAHDAVYQIKATIPPTSVSISST
jgi:hypothetical protein